MDCNIKRTTKAGYNGVRKEKTRIRALGGKKIIRWTDRGFIRFIGMTTRKEGGEKLKDVLKICLRLCSRLLVTAAGT